MDLSAPIRWKRDKLGVMGTSKECRPPCVAPQRVNLNEPGIDQIHLVLRIFFELNLHGLVEYGIFDAKEVILTATARTVPPWTRSGAATTSWNGASGMICFRKPEPCWAAPR